MYLTGEFPDAASTAVAIEALQARRLTTDDLDVFSTEPVELPAGVLRRPSRMSLAAVLGAATIGGGVTGFLYFTQHQYRLITGGMPIFSFWATGVVTYEMTMLGAIAATFLFMLHESGLIWPRNGAPAPAVEPGSIVLRVHCPDDQVTETGECLYRAGATRVEKLPGPSRDRKGAVLPILLGLLSLSSSLPAADQKPLPWEKNRHLGQDLYREHCAVCHDIAKPHDPKSKKPGPSLHRLFQNEKLPLTGAKPSRDYVTVKIKFGGQIMPPFIKRMTDAEVNAVVDYIEASGRR